MGRGKALTDDEKAIIIKETAKVTSPNAIAEKIGRHVDSVKRYLKDPSAKKKRLNAGFSKAVSARDLREIGRYLRRNP